MAKLPLITLVTPETGPAKIVAVPKTLAGDPKAYFDTDTGTVVADKLDAPVFNTTHDGLVPASNGDTVNFLRADGTWAAPAGMSQPYDFSSKFVGTPATSSILAEWVVCRTVTLSTTDWVFWCVTRPTTNATNLLVKKNGTTIATFQFTNSSTQTNNRYEGALSGSITATTLELGDFLTVETDTTVDSAFATPIFSIKGSV